MRLTMISIGSTGDVRPYVLLGRELKHRGHEVKIACFAQFEKMVKDAELEFHPLSGNIVNIMSQVMTGNGVAYLRHFESAIKGDLPCFIKDLQDACDGADALMCTFFGSVVYAIAEKKRIPCIQTHYFLMDMNGNTPITCAPGQHVGRIWNKATYRMGYFFINSLEKRYLTQWRKEEGMRPKKIRTCPDYWINGRHVPVLYAMSPILTPRPLTWDEHFHMTGFWVENQVDSYEPSPALSAFLEEGEKPVYIGFGSMVSGNMEKTMDIVLEAVRRANVRAVIARGWGGEQLGSADRKRIFTADYLPHGWLFPRVAGVVHHGGAGTTAAGIMAGRPTLIIPFGGDQPYWGERVYQLGVGPKAIRRERLSVNRLAKALRELVDTPSYAVAAQELGSRMRMENGVCTAADIVEREVAMWPKSEERV